MRFADDAIYRLFRTRVVDDADDGLEGEARGANGNYRVGVIGFIAVALSR